MTEAFRDLRALPAWGSDPHDLHELENEGAWLPEHRLDSLGAPNARELDEELSVIERDQNWLLARVAELPPHSDAVLRDLLLVHAELRTRAEELRYEMIALGFRGTWDVDPPTDSHVRGHRQQLRVG